jgi:hypothetical protein
MNILDSTSGYEAGLPRPEPLSRVGYHEHTEQPYPAITPKILFPKRNDIL